MELQLVSICTRFVVVWLLRPSKLGHEEIFHLTSVTSDLEDGIELQFSLHCGKY